MRPAPLLRIAAIVNLLFALGHTIGFLSFRPSSAEGRAALAALGTVFSEDGTRFSYIGFYKGFGLSCSLAMLLAAALSWWLGGLARSAPRATVTPALIFAIYGLAALVLALLYFPLQAIIFSLVLPILYLLAAIGAARAST